MRVEHLVVFGISFLVSLPISILWVYIIDRAKEKEDLYNEQKEPKLK
jgi:hypothetical protein